MTSLQQVNSREEEHAVMKMGTDNRVVLFFSCPFFLSILLHSP